MSLSSRLYSLSVSFEWKGNALTTLIVRDTTRPDWEEELPIKDGGIMSPVGWESIKINGDSIVGNSQCTITLTTETVFKTGVPIGTIILEYPNTPLWNVIPDYVKVRILDAITVGRTASLKSKYCS